MQGQNGKSGTVRRWLWTGFKLGLSIAVFDFLFFFLFLDRVRETTREILGNSMKPLLLTTPLAIAGLCLIGWLLITYCLPGTVAFSNRRLGDGGERHDPR